MALITYRPKELVTLDAPITSYKGKELEFEGAMLHYTACIGDVELINKTKKLLQQHATMTLATFIRVMDDEMAAGAYTLLVVTRGLRGVENAWTITRKPLQRSSGAQYVYVNNRRLHVAKQAGMGFEVVEVTAVNGEGIRAATWVVANVLLQPKKQQDNTCVYSAGPKGMSILPLRDLMGEYDLLTKMSELPV